MVRLIGYTRVSPEHQERERESCTIQRQRLGAYCDAQADDVELVDVETDQDVSGKSMDRPAWTRVLARIEAGEADGVVVYKLDRLTRRLQDLLDVISLFRDRGWQLHAVADKIDTSTATGRLVVHILGSIAEWERDTMRERTSAALRHKIKSGLHIGGVPYGWRRAVGADGKLTAIEAVPEQQAIIARIRNRDELTQEQMAAQLNRERVPAPAGGQWSRRSIQCVLSQPESPASMISALAGQEA